MSEEEHEKRNILLVVGTLLLVLSCFVVIQLIQYQVPRGCMSGIKLIVNYNDELWEEETINCPNVVFEDMAVGISLENLNTSYHYVLFQEACQENDGNGFWLLVEEGEEVAVFWVMLNCYGFDLLRRDPSNDSKFYHDEWNWIIHVDAIKE